MPIFDHDGTTKYEIGRLADHDNTEQHTIGKVYDDDGTTMYLIYSAEEILLGSGATSNVYNTSSNWTGGGTFTISASSLRWQGGGGQASQTKKCSQALPTGFSTLTVNVSSFDHGSGSLGGATCKLNVGTTAGGNNIGSISLTSAGTKTLNVDGKSPIYISIYGYCTYTPPCTVNINLIKLS